MTLFGGVHKRSQVLVVPVFVLKTQNSHSISIFSLNFFAPGDQKCVSKTVILSHQDAIGRPKLSAKATVSSQLNQVVPRRAAKTSWQNHAILRDKSHHTKGFGPQTIEGAHDSL